MILLTLSNWEKMRILDYFHTTSTFGSRLLSIINNSAKFDWLWFISQIVQHALFNIFLRTTVPLVSYIRNSLRFWYYASLSTCCQNLEKIGVTWKIWEKAGVKLLRDLTEKSVNFSTLATFNIRLLLVFGEEDQ